MKRTTIPALPEVLQIATQILAARFQRADAAFVAGSLIRGEGSGTSDIDLVVLHSSLPSAYRESFLFAGVPVECFVHDPETLAWFLDQDRKEGHPALPGMLVEGTIIGPRLAVAEALQRHARQMLASGPPPLSPEQMGRLRYAISDKLDDLEADRSCAELLAIGAALYPLLVELALRGGGRWSGTGKWGARLLGLADEALAREIETAFLALYERSEGGPVLRLARKLLAPHGGRLFEGYRDVAPAAWRAPISMG